MLDGIFHQRLQQQIGNLRLQELGRNVDAHLKTLRKANLLDVEIALQILDFLRQRHLRSVGILRGSAQKLAEPDDHPHGRIVAPIAHQSRDGIERVEHEVRLHLPAQRCELSPGEFLIEARRLGPLPGRVFARVHHIGDGQYQRVHEDECQALVQERLAPQMHEGTRPLWMAPRIKEHRELPPARSCSESPFRCSKRSGSGRPLPLHWEPQMLPTPYRFHPAARTGGIAFGLLRVLLLLLLLLLALLLLPVTPARAQHASTDPVASAGFVQFVPAAPPVRVLDG